MSAGGLGGGQPPSVKAVSKAPRESPSQGPAEGRTVGMLSLGCPKNLVDGEVMLGRLQGAGYRLVADVKQADVVVVNTCAFIDRAKQESVDAILEMAREKEAGRAKRLVVTAPVVSVYRGKRARQPKAYFACLVDVTVTRRAGALIVRAA